MDIKDELALTGITWSEVENIEYNTIGEFQTRYSNTTRYFIVQCKSNSYNLKEQYTWHAFDLPVIIPEGELVCTTKLITPTRKIPYWYHEPYEAIPVIVKLKHL